MAELSLLVPTVLRRVVNNLTPPEQMTWLNRVNKTPFPFPVAEWDIEHGGRSIAVPNTPNSEANVVDQEGIGHGMSTFIYTREKKVFLPTTTRWIRDVSNNLGGTATKQRAEAAVTRELADLNRRVDNFQELCWWKAVSTGQIALDYKKVQATPDYQFKASHKPTSAVSWANATPEQIVSDIQAWKRLILQDSGIASGIEAYTSERNLQDIFNSFAFTGDGASTNGFVSAALLSDRAKDEYYRTGILAGFQGIDWHSEDAVYDPTDSQYGENPTERGQDTPFLARNKVVFGNFTSGNPIEQLNGLSADFEAPENYTGKFTKTYTNPDPSGLAALLELNFMPIITKPDQIIAATIG